MFRSLFRCLFVFHALVTSFLLVGCQSSVSNDIAVSPLEENGPSKFKSQDQQAVRHYEQVIANLLKDDGVLPYQLPIHPVTSVYNREAIIPPQCYTRTEGKHNPCYVCHQNAIKGGENVMNDGGLQAAYSFSDQGLTNHWQNLFKDRSAQVAAISDEEIEAWIAQDNYSNLAPRLQQAQFKGWIPDLDNLQEGPIAFDEEGFAKDGSLWVAFNYKPMPSTFWPTNGSTDDVMIRLGKRFRSDKQGNYSRDIYKANLAILEANIKSLDEITVHSIDERVIGVDLDKNGKLTRTTVIKKIDNYVGMAEDEYIDTHLYPAFTEFLHTVRYVGIDEQGNVYNTRRMKEVRYMKKWQIYAKQSLARYYMLESFEKEAGNLPGYHNLKHHGLDNGMGWSVVGFIENHRGELRFNSFEENLFCMGCHNSIGATIDKVFSFSRKIDGQKGWGYIDIKGMPDAPNKGEKQGEFLTYLQRVGGGGEFRSNPEMQSKWFNADGTVDSEKVKNAEDIHALIVPSKARAQQLNKAYKVIVDEQSFIFGRDATVTPPKNVYREVDNETSPTLQAENLYDWDIRLQW